MPTNYLTQFATSGTANLPVESTWQNLTERATGFQTGLARSSYFNRLFAQGANAAYVLGQLVVDYASADADLDGATLYTNFKTALNSYVGGSFLPLAGGTMTGTLTNSQSDFNIRKTIDTGRTILRGSTDYSKGASLYLNGKDYSGTVPAGAWELIAHDGSNAKSLRGEPGGKLTWAGNYLIFPTGGIIRADGGGNYINLWAGENNFDGCSLQLYGRSHASYPGRFYLRASTKSSGSSTGDSCDLGGRPSGELLWGSKKIAVGKGTYTVNGLVAYGYITSGGNQLSLVLPLRGVGSSITFSSITGAVRVGTGGYTTPGSGTDSLLPVGVTQTTAMGDEIILVTLVKSDGWGAGATNNSTVVAAISVTFTIS